MVLQSPRKFTISEMIFATIVGVLQRPRFGLVVEVAGKLQCKIEKDGYRYTLRVYPGTMSTSIGVMKETLEQPLGSDLFFTNSVNHSHLPKIRLIGTTIANKIKMRVFHSVMGD